ncbi:MAG: tyrosine-type recombinase/integrase [Bacillota bacterium]|nr:tyrosine-type recombinase/integrase [Bacillota bacterium]
MHSLPGGESVIHPRPQEARPEARAPRLERETLLRAERALRLTPQPRRNRALLHLTIAFGCMPDDLAQLRLEDIDLKSQRIRWRKAGGTARLSEPLLDDLQQYVERERRGRGERLFLTRLGHPVEVRTLALFFRRLAREVGDAHLSPLALRERRLRLLLERHRAAAWARHRGRWLYLADPSPLADEEEADSAVAVLAHR